MCDKEKKDELSSLAFHLGCIRGLLTRPSLRTTLISKGLLSSQVGEFEKWVNKIAEVFYK